MNITKVGVVGAGTMGNGIAQACAVVGIPVIMVDIAQEAVDKGIKTIDKSLDRLVSREKISEADKQAALDRVTGSTSYDDLKSADLVIEAATENHELKNKIMQQLDVLLDPQVLLATNTSSISITQLAAKTGRADRFVGMHFFNPVPVMKLVELVPSLLTSPDTTRRARDFVQSQLGKSAIDCQAVAELAKKLGKTPITVKNAPGFVVNRILVPMINEAFYVLAEGLASPEDIDAGMKLGCNHPIGPLALADMVGIDVCLAVMEVYLEQFGDSKYRPCPLMREYVAAGRLGRKTGQGVYQY